jgi:hypothetical protein
MNSSNLGAPKTDARGGFIPPSITKERLAQIRLFADTQPEPLKTDLYLLVINAERVIRWDDQTTS